MVDLKLLELPTGNQPGSHAISGLARLGKLSATAGDREEDDGGQYIISNSSLGAAQDRPVQQSQTTGTSSIPTNFTDNSSSLHVDRLEESKRLTTSELLPTISSTEPEPEAGSDPSVLRSQTTILEPTFLFSTETSTWQAPVQSHFFKILKVKASHSLGGAERLEYDIVTESSPMSSEDVTETIIIRKCSYSSVLRRGTV